MSDEYTEQKAKEKLNLIYTLAVLSSVIDQGADKIPTEIVEHFKLSQRGEVEVQRFLWSLGFEPDSIHSQVGCKEYYIQTLSIGSY